MRCLRPLAPYPGGCAHGTPRNPYVGPARLTDAVIGAASPPQMLIVFSRNQTLGPLGHTHSFPDAAGGVLPGALVGHHHELHLVTHLVARLPSTSLMEASCPPQPRTTGIQTGL